MKKHFFSIILIVLTILISIISFPSLPATLAIQFSENNAPSNTAPKIIGIAIIPIVMLFLHLTRANSKRFVHSANYFEAKLIFYIAQFVLFGAQVCIILYGLGYRFDINFVVKITLGLIFIIVGNYLYRARRSYGHGIKNRYTLSNTRVWQKTHKFCSGVFVIVGVLVILITLFIDNNSNTSYTATAIVLGGGVFLSYLSSYVFYLKYKDES